jgi:hypothetical protein
MSSPLPTETIVAQLQLEVEQLKKNYRQAVWERLAILGPPRHDEEWPEIFVLMPFTAELVTIYEDHIKKAVAESEFELRVGRADDFFGPRPIMKDVWSAIHAARIIIADCTGRNPNVFYEIGLAHAIGRYTILISQSLDDIPFDLRHLRIILYKYTPPGMKAFETALIETIKRGAHSPALLLTDVAQGP